MLRKNQIGYMRWALATLAAAAIFALPSLGLADDDSDREDGRTITLSVENAEFEFTSMGGLFGRDFVVVGDVTAVNGETASGTFYCMGVLLGDGSGMDGFGAATFVDQRFRIDGRGTILGAGAEGDDMGESLAIVGGTGRFIGGQGSYRQTGGLGPMPAGDGTIEYTFRIRSGAHGKHDERHDR
jgi:hypothetical protein